MTQFLVIRPGSTDFDEQGRIKGTLDIPLSDAGTVQVNRIVAELHEQPINVVYASPSKSAEQTAKAIAADHKLKVKELEELQNLDHGLWHGKLIDEVRQSQPKVFRQLQDHPETVCPPEGEPVGVAMDRVKGLLDRLRKKHRTGVVALVVPEPLASLVYSTLNCCEVGDLWKVECQAGHWQLVNCNGSESNREVLTWRGATHQTP